MEMTSILRTEAAHQSTRPVYNRGLSRIYQFELASKCYIWFLRQIGISFYKDFQQKALQIQFKYNVNHLPKSLN